MRRAAFIALAIVTAIAVIGAAYLVWMRASGEPAREAPVTVPAQWPLTGEQALGTDDVGARVVSVKVDNIPAARPQDGLDEADIVYETLAEGGITRFHALYHSRTPQRIGPVRSARPPDVRLVDMYRSILLFSGANSVVLRMIADAGIDSLDETSGGRAFSRDPARQPPHNLYVDLWAARDVAADAGFAAEAQPVSIEFGEITVEGDPAEEAAVPFNPANQVVWTYNEATRLYERQLNGMPHGDEGGSPNYSAANVVVVFAEVLEGQRPGTTDVVLDDSGDAILYRDGQRFDCGWSAQAGIPLSLTATDGTVLPLAVGQTWVEVVPREERERFGRQSGVDAVE
jgi:hypothetical protein